MNRYPEYKESGIEWIGEIPEHWEVKRIKHTTYVKGRIGWKGLRSDEFLEKSDSLVVTGTDFKNGKVNWSTCYEVPQDRYDEDPFIQLKENDLLITKDGTIGKIALVENMPKIATLNSGVFVTRPITDDYITPFMYWALVSDVFKSFYDFNKSGSTIQHLYQNVFNEFKFVCPPLNEQVAIDHYLKTKTEQVDSLINNKQKLIELLKEERTAIINQAVTKGLDPNVPMKVSGIEWLGDVPEHWEVKKLKYVFDSLNSVRVPLSAEDRGKMENKIYDYYGASGVIDQVDNYLFDEELILLGEDGANLLTRSKRLAFIAKGQYWVNNHAHIIKPKRGDIYYLCELLELMDYTIHISGSAQPKLTQEALMSIDIIEPPIEEQNSIIRYLFEKFDAIDETINKIEQEINLLKEYKTALISEVVTGKVDVREEILEETCSSF
jgi:type I restriction enzyme, S subunit